MRNFLLISFSIFFAITTDAQDRPVCFTTEYIEYIAQANPSSYQSIIETENRLNDLLQGNSPAKNSADDPVYTIPVVFHVVYNIELENVSDEQLLSQLEVLNADFKRLNGDTTDTPFDFLDVAADPGIQFVIAEIDPDGNFTNGITRTSTEITHWNLNTNPADSNFAQKIKFSDTGGEDIWDPYCYLNIWVADIGTAVLGFSQLPGGDTTTDGVVIGYQWIGNGGTSIFPYNKGRTATHEVGHWLGLKHIWGDDEGSCAGSDLIADTPNQAKETFGCPDFPKLDGCSPTTPGIMFMNYMDYTDDRGMNLFTQGQVNKMRMVLETERDEILACVEYVGIQENIKTDGINIKLFPNPASEFIALSIQRQQAKPYDIEIYNSLGLRLIVLKLNSAEQTHVIDLHNYSLGIYYLKVTDGLTIRIMEFSVIN